MVEVLEVICPYCGSNAVLIDSAHVYGGRSYGMIWICEPCDAYVGTHANNEPLGSLANAELRKMRTIAHKAFDPLWQTKMKQSKCSKSKARGDGYKWLAQKLKIDIKNCHIGKFYLNQCKRVVEICTKE